ncbi:MAG: hypothetical protein QME52_08260 [Bacteroidota bacterium]|nr:hypothetical protein [Bacteroidota bacterium]
MEKRLPKIALLVVTITSIIWLGGINIRTIIGFDLLQTGTLDFKPNIHPYVERTVFGLIAQSSILINIAYIILWISGIIFLRTTHLNLKENGWLMICAILFYIFTPVEIYTMILDFRMWYLDFLGSSDLVEFRKLFIHRLGALAGVPMIALLCYYTAIAIATFQPMRRMKSTKSC